jgi:3'(2'), 5'-bisphosphate nucleotidase
MSLPEAHEVLAIAEEAGRLILEHYRQSDLGARAKEDGSPVTEADIAADALLRRALAARWPHPIVSEETAPAPYELRRSWSRFWLVDPLDGTRDFVGRTDEFCVNVALVEGDRPVVGVVAAPALGVSWIAERGGGALRIEAGAIRKMTCSRDQGRWIALKSRFHPSPDADAFYAALGIEEVVVRGSTLKICVVAEGLADAYASFGPAKEWDLAPGQLIAEEAGAFVRVVGTDETPRYNQELLTKPPVLFCSRRFFERYSPAYSLPR